MRGHSFADRSRLPAAPPAQPGLNGAPDAGLSLDLRYGFKGAPVASDTSFPWGVWVVSWGVRHLRVHWDWGVKVYEGLEVLPGQLRLFSGAWGIDFKRLRWCGCEAVGLGGALRTTANESTERGVSRCWWFVTTGHWRGKAPHDPHSRVHEVLW